MRLNALLILMTLTVTAFAEVKLPTLFNDGMVLQREMPIPVWGWAAPQQAVTVELAGQKATVTAGQDGRWSLRLAPLQAGGPHVLRVTAGTTIERQDVLIGDVWIASGQSNMYQSASILPEAEELFASADNDQLRLFTVNRFVSLEPQQDLEGGKWKVASAEAARRFSAVGYCFGRRLQERTGVPIGIIACSVGATMAEHWMPAEILAADPQLQVHGVARWEEWQQTWPHGDIYPDPYKDVEGTYRRAFAEVRRLGRELNLATRDGAEPPAAFTAERAIHVEAYKIYKYVPSGLFNAMIKPMIPYGIKGTIWYQGESNSDQPDTYAHLLPALITSWRDAWGQGDFPFYIVSLASFRPVNSEPVDSKWARIREVQWQTQSLPNVGTALAIDLGEADDIHPRNKAPVGYRLARLALARDYGHDIIDSGPVFDSMKVADGEVRLTFAHAHGGLKTTDGNPPRNFALAGEDRVFHWAQAKIVDEQTIVLQSEEVATPIAVRYAWSDNPAINLVNAELLPAAPFRTDTWPEVDAKGTTSDEGNEP